MNEFGQLLAYASVFLAGFVCGAVAFILFIGWEFHDPKGG